MLLRDETLQPTEEALKNTLKPEVYASWSALLPRLGSEHGITGEWRYYNDGKAWLFKAACKKKTIFWLSAWEDFLKISFYFTDTTAAGIEELNVSDDIKTAFANCPKVGKLKPLTLEISNIEQLDALFEIIRYKLTVL